MPVDLAFLATKRCLPLPKNKQLERESGKSLRRTLKYSHFLEPTPRTGAISRFLRMFKGLLSRQSWTGPERPTVSANEPKRKLCALHAKLDLRSYFQISQIILTGDEAGLRYAAAPHVRSTSACRWTDHCAGRALTSIGLRPPNQVWMRDRSVSDRGEKRCS